MWIISKSRLREFWESGHSAAKEPLLAWYKDVEHADWAKWADVKAMYGSVDQVGDCVVFNIGGNKYRLIARIRYNLHKVFILKVLTHREYDTDKWKDDCGCYTSPPAKPRKRR